MAAFPGSKATPETLYYTGSTTKSCTAAAAVSLFIDDTVGSPKPLEWITPVSSLIRDGFVFPNQYATAHITLEDVLSHRVISHGHGRMINQNQETALSSAL
ncbi:hypothetical protein MMC06_000668 [Schaereria dolodes]|nr:hypothetical protein [Schaereria dolodes]